MPESIKDTIDRVLQPYQYQLPPEAGQVVSEIVVALESREANIADMLRHQARTAGLRQPMVERALMDVGLSGMPDPSMDQVMPERTPEQRSFLEELRGLLSRCEQMVKDARERFGI